MKRPKTPRPERLDHKGRKIIPQVLRDDLLGARQKVNAALQTLAVAHGNYGLGDFLREYDALLAVSHRLDEVCRTTTTNARLESEARYGL